MSRTAAAATKRSAERDVVLAPAGEEPPSRSRPKQELARSLQVAEESDATEGERAT